MTLHWWMHWFWVTMLLIVFASIKSSAAPQSEELQHITTEDVNKPNRQGKALYIPKITVLTTSTAVPVLEHNTNNTDSTEQDTPTTNTEDVHQELNNNSLETSHPSFVKLTNHTDETHPTIIELTNNTNASQTTIVELTNQTVSNNKSENVTETEIQKVDTENESVNKTDRENSTLARKKNLTSEVKEIDSSIDVAESRIVSEKPLSLETSFVQTRLPPVLESSRRILDQERPKTMDTGAIAGISFAALVLAALAGSTGFVVYRRRYLNKPQTLNDKCSNPDSSGYLDDSTVRDNSEEMYSLDNDSFLNSLEAMTIQNYWTDTVKHTKL